MQEEVHRPVEHLRVLTQVRRAGQVDVLAGPLQSGELRGGGQGPVRDQGEQHPLRRAVERQRPVRVDGTALLDALDPLAPYAARVASHRPLIESVQFEIDLFEGLVRGRLARDPGTSKCRPSPGSARSWAPPSWSPRWATSPGAETAAGDGSVPAERCVPVSQNDCESTRSRSRFNPTNLVRNGGAARTV